MTIVAAADPVPDAVPVIAPATDPVLNPIPVVALLCLAKKVVR